MVSPPHPEDSATAMGSDRPWLAIALGSLLLLMYAPLLYHWADGWLYKTISLEHEYFSHGLLGLPFAAYIAWQKRSQWQALPTCAPGGGGILLLIGLGGYWSPLNTLVSLSLPLMLTGLCLWLKGRNGLRLMRFPLLLVLLATPTDIPYLIAPHILPLQRLIASVAGFLLSQLGMNVQVSHIYLYVNQQTVEVAPHCAGLKMLFTSIYAGLILIYWSTRCWQPIILPFLCGILGLSVSANILRNAILAALYGHGHIATFKWLHDSWGGDLYSALMLVSLIPILRLVEQWFGAKSTGAIASEPK